MPRFVMLKRLIDEPDVVVTADVGSYTAMPSSM
jgi:hypothetical protein